MVSLLRNVVGPRVFKAVHWATYALWPVALLHALGTGTDAGSLWMDAVAVACTVSVVCRGRLAAAPVVRRTRPCPHRQRGRTMSQTIEMPRAVAGPTTTQRLLGTPPDLPLPHLDAAELIALVEEAGLTGRGGAGFPTARKLRAVAGHGPVVVGNAMEGEPLSAKDAVLLDRAPGLVVDGLSLLASALRARRVVLATGPEVPSGPVTAAARGTRVEVVPVTDGFIAGGFVAGQESALVNRLDGRRGVPSDPIVPVWRRGVDGRPPWCSTPRRSAQLALLARYGAGWFRSLGTPDDPGTFLATITGSTAGIVATPGVLEAPRGTPLLSLLERAGDGARPRRCRARRWLPRRVGARHRHLDVLTTTRRPRPLRRLARRRRGARARPGRPVRSRSAPASRRTSPARAPASAGPASTACRGWPRP